MCYNSRIYVNIDHVIQKTISLMFCYIYIYIYIYKYKYQKTTI